MKNKKTKLKERLKEGMDMRGMKAADLCAKTGIPKSAMSYYLAGKSEPKDDRIFLISQALDVEEPWLMGYDVPMIKRSIEQKMDDAQIDIANKFYNNPEFNYAVSLLDKLNPDQFSQVTALMKLFCKEASDEVQ